jgi:hypothetical protein
MIEKSLFVLLHSQLLHHPNPTASEFGCAPVNILK